VEDLNALGLKYRLAEGESALEVTALARSRKKRPS
jgi:hypothetical protein